ncbi:MAG: hypothetical protein KAI74_05335 [Kiritimatiellae bacterium]|nr:hypothetical protein [Kiritimatiellia bacterium]
MRLYKDRLLGFTLVELLISISLLVMTLSFGMAGFVYFLRSTAQGNIQNELDIDVQTAMERMKYDLRLSSLDEMFYYPAGIGPYESISFPLARDDDGDGAVEIDASTGKIIWDQTRVYHVWKGSPNELRLTVFDPRDNTLTDVERQAQINSVVTSGDGKSTYNSANSSSEIIFANLFDWSIAPNGAIYDAYSPVQIRDTSVSLGSIVLSNGTHDITFKVVDKNDDSSGYRIGVDTLYASPCYGALEAERLLPVVAQGGAVAVAQDMALQGSWSGNYQLNFDATAVDQFFTVRVENDLWEETNFRGTGTVFDNTQLSFNQLVYPKDFVVSLEGDDWCWYSTEQTGDLYPSYTDALAGTAIRVMIRGEDMINGGWIDNNGQDCWIYFYAGNDYIKLDGAYIAECADHEIPSMDINPSAIYPLTLYPAISDTNMYHYAWASSSTFVVEKEKSYMVSFLVNSAPDQASLIEYQEQIEPTMMNSYIIPATNAPTVADLALASWSSLTNVNIIATNSILGIQSIYTFHPANGQFVSQIIDTRQDAPSYSDMSWNQVVPWGAALSMKIRSGDNSDMSDAPAWSNVTAMASSGSINPGDKRYFQFYADLQPTADKRSTPSLKDVTVKWSGVERYVDIGGTFTKGPDHGIFKVLVDDKEIKTGVLINLEIFETTRGYAGEDKEMTSSLSSEVTPRNTGM